MQAKQDSVSNDTKPRQQYSAPQLTQYGRVRDLTAGGSGPKGEKTVPGHQYTRHA
ncbi:hypothetical protein GCM10027431_07380 [Lysobacter rhizosphaerae]